MAQNMNKKMNKKMNRFIGTLVGGCIGDVLGSTNEGKKNHQINTVVGYNGPQRNEIQLFQQNRYTDDTELTIVLARYIVKFNNVKTPYCACEEVHKMYHKTVRNSKRGYSQRTKSILGEWNKFMPAGTASTNGAIMRIAPLGLTKDSKTDPLYTKIENMLYFTHGKNKDAVDTAFLHCKLINMLVNTPEGTSYTPEQMYTYSTKITAQLRNPVLHALVMSIHPDNKKRFIENNWNVTKTLFGWDLFQIEAIHCYICVLVCFFYNFNDPVKAIIFAANMGGDTNTIAKMVGDLVGANHGINWIPPQWKDPEGREELEMLGRELYNQYSLEV